MKKGKLERFKEMKDFSNVIQPSFKEVYGKDHKLKGMWNTSFFMNENPVVLELGCGKGEYTVGLAEKYPQKNFLGIDIKGARMWRGAKIALEENLDNVGFLRTRIELINSFFIQNEVDEIWITFPDPQLKKKKKRLTSGRFLNSYKMFLKKEGWIHLKTDNPVLYNYTLNLALKNNLTIQYKTVNLYAEADNPESHSIQTFYEKQFLGQGLNIHYLKFNLSNVSIVEEPDDEE